MKNLPPLAMVLVFAGAVSPPSAAAAATPPERVAEQAEREMATRPRESLLIARQAADQLAGRADLARRVFAAAARFQEERLADLGENQVAELAGVCAGTLGDATAAGRVQRRWLELRQASLGPGDGPGCLQVARLYLRWLDDRETAAKLCQQALQRTPELTAAASMLREDLHYQRTKAGWLPDRSPPADPAADPPRIRPGMTADEVRHLLGPPRRVARQILFRRYLEQWTYDHPTPLRVEFNALQGQELHVQTVHELLPPP